ncbi:MAG: ribbon-helix-helix protein, CopG family [Phycisphaerae bacterium]|nr:ribbon-helix-helix protein, CopG family [Phycisphaerae bacterium]
MSALTIRLDDEKYARLKELARKRHTSVNKLFDEMTTLILAEADAETRFSLRAARGKNQAQRGLELLAKARQ